MIEVLINDRGLIRILIPPSYFALHSSIYYPTYTPSPPNPTRSFHSHAQTKPSDSNSTLHSNYRLPTELPNAFQPCISSINTHSFIQTLTLASHLWYRLKKRGKTRSSYHALIHHTHKASPQIYNTTHINNHPPTINPTAQTHHPPLLIDSAPLK